jgi:predicted dehydrogenase
MTATRDTVRLGVIGFGVRGTECAHAVASKSTARIVGVADLYTGRRARAAELLGADVFTTGDHRQLLARRDVDAVVIATPDHSHVPLAVDALQAGKDVYCESPVIHIGQDSALLREAAAQRIIQVGGALESSAACAKARDVLRSGRVGTITMVRATWDTVSALDAWQRPFPPDASPDTIDFAAFLGATPARAFDLHRFFRWPCYWDYGSGLAGARIVPLLTAIQSLLGANAPVTGSLAGGTWRWKDGREVPDALTGTFDFAEGFTATVSVTQNGREQRELVFVGTTGTLVVTGSELIVLPASDAEPYVSLGDSWPKEYRDWFYMMHGLSQQGAPRREFPARGGEERHEIVPNGDSLPAHLGNFIECVRTRQQPTEPLLLGVQAADAVARASSDLRQRTRLVRR